MVGFALSRVSTEVLNSPHQFADFWVNTILGPDGIPNYLCEHVGDARVCPHAIFDHHDDLWSKRATRTCEGHVYGAKSFVVNLDLVDEPEVDDSDV